MLFYNSSHILFKTVNLNPGTDFNIKYIYVSVVFKNVKGFEFWTKNNYEIVKKIYKKVEISKNTEEIIVMRKII